MKNLTLNSHSVAQITEMKIAHSIIYNFYILLHPFSLIFYHQRKPRYYNLSTNGGLGEENINKIHLGVPGDQKDNFSPNIKFIYSAWYRPKSFQFGQSAHFGGGLDIYEWGWTWVKIQLCLNLGEGMLRSQKCKIHPFFG